MVRHLKSSIFFVLVIALIVPFFALNVSAEAFSFQSDLWYDVLDNSFVGNTGVSNFSWVNETSNVITFDLVEGINFFYTIDMIVEFLDAPSAVYYVSPYHGNIPLNVDKISGNFYRVYGMRSRNDGMTHSLRIEYPSAGNRWVNVYKCEVLRTLSTYYELDASGELRWGSNTYNFTYDASNHEANQNISFYGSGNTRDFVAHIKFPQADWKKYDYIDVHILISTQQINSITAVCNGALPLYVNKVESTDIAGNYYLTLRIDLRNVLRNVNDYPMIIINGTVKTGTSSSNLFAFTSVSGYLSLPEPNMWFLYFNNLHGWLTQGFNDIVEALGGGDAAGDNPLPDAVSQQNSINSGVAAINGVSKPDVSAGELDISGYVGGFAHFGTILSIPLNNSTVIFNVFMITFILMMGAYILFGKRG